MPKILPVKNTTAFEDAEIATIVRWVHRYLGGFKAADLAFAEVGKARGGESNYWRFTAPGIKLRLSDNYDRFPTKVRVGIYNDEIACTDYRETLIVCAAVTMSYAADYTDWNTNGKHVRPGGLKYDTVTAIDSAQRAVNYYRAHVADVDALIVAAQQREAERATAGLQKREQTTSWAARREKLAEQRDRWKSKLKRAETAIKKLDKKIRAGDRYQAKKEGP